MERYFNVNLEFDHSRIHEVIENTVVNSNKGYVCAVDGNVITMAQKDLEYRSVLNSSLINTCDGSSIAVLAGWIHNKKYKALNGPTIFAQYIEKSYRQLLLGSTEAIVNKIKNKLQTKGISSDNIYTIILPFNSVEEFEYQDIANKINRIGPDFIWVSLGAPKQEKFMMRLLPYINRGVMFGIGAAFNFYIGELGMPRRSIGRLKLIWLNRFVNEPFKLSKRLVNYILWLPVLYITERKSSRRIG